MGEARFAPYFPDDCPPDSAQPAAGVAYRCIQGASVVEEDLQDHVQKNLRPDAPLCLRCAISVFRSFRGASHARKKWPRIGRFIARAELAAEHGKCDAPDKNDHLNWWPYVDVDRVALFEVVEA